MPLDLDRASQQISQMASSLKDGSHDRAARLDEARRLLAASDATALNTRRQEGKVTFLVPRLTETPAARYKAPVAPEEFSALAVDGSHIDVDRHSPARCYLINIGKVHIRYGTQPVARLSSEPRLYAEEGDLVMLDPASGAREQWLEGALLGIKRSVDEVRALATLVAEAQQSGPALALVDGSLILWGLSGQAYPDFVRHALLDEAMLPALDQLRQQAQQHDLGVAAYISLPRSTEVANALRLGLCPYKPPDCDRHCSRKRPGQRECDEVQGITDRELFDGVLAAGERSALFASTSSIVEQHYGQHKVCFFYINAGPEIGRVEIPAWVADRPDLVELTHALVFDQCQRGQGYPVAIAEAHEQAVLTGADRELFQRLVEEALANQGMPVYTSEKSMSKRLKWL